MQAFRYRAATADGALKTGVIQGTSVQEAIDALRRSGLRPIETAQVRQPRPRPARPLPGRALAKIFNELAVMTRAGIPLDRALAVAANGAETPRVRQELVAIHASVREGAPLSQALSERRGAFPSLATAMCAAGEADGQPASAMKKLGEALARAQALQETLVSAAVYPIMLFLIAVGVISLMLFWVVPQFESLFSEGFDQLPMMTKAVLSVSRFARSSGQWVVLGLPLVGVGIWRALRDPSVRRVWDKRSLQLPIAGALLSKAELARFFRVLGSLADGGVALPDALAISRRSLLNTHLADAVGRVATGLREGQELTGPLAATGILPPLAISYLRTGEESAQLPLMLNGLADVLDDDVRTGAERAIAILTPLITVTLGALVATVIASIMSAILGFNDLAMTR